MPAFGIDIETLRISLQEASLAGVGISFVTGLVFSFNPVSFASIPVVLAYVTKERTQRRAVLLGAAFVMGMLVTHAVLGVAAALGGRMGKAQHGARVGAIAGATARGAGADMARLAKDSLAVDQSSWE